MARPDEELPLSRRKPVAEDVRQELEDHLERRVEELVAQGTPPTAARADALRAFGDLGRVSAECRDITTRDRQARQRSERLDGLLHDLRFGARLLRRSPTFALVAIVTLALGVGANSAIFSLINGVLFRPLPYDHGEQLVNVVELHAKGWGNLSYANFIDIRAQSRSFQQLAEIASDRETLLGANQPIRASVGWVTSDFFPMMRAHVELGRLTTPDDHRLGAAPVAVISDRFWREHFGANRDLTSLRLRGEFAFQVVGVMAPGFDYPTDAEVWVPFELEHQATSRTAHNAPAIGRLRDGVTPAAATQDVAAVLHRIGATAGDDFDAVGGKVTSLQADLAGPARQPLLLLMGASTLLLLIACTNLASTLLARGTGRQPEIAVRTAIGAGRRRIVRQVFTESLLISVLGCGAGLLLAEAMLRGMSRLAPASLALIQRAHLDLAVLGFTAAVAVLTAVAFGFLPALRMSDVDTGQLMRGARGGTIRRGHVWSTLVTIEVALAVVLLIGSALMIRSFAKVMQVNLGFDPEHVVTAAIDLPEINYPDVQQAVRFHDQALAQLRAIPGVEAAGVTNVLPVDGGGPNGGLQVEGKPQIVKAFPVTGFGVYRLASVGFFRAMGMRILRGRDFSESDQPTSLPVAIVNQEMADKEWPGEDPIGKRFRPAGMDNTQQQPWATVIGVVDNVPATSLTTPPGDTYYYSYRQLPFRARYLTAAVRSALPPAQLQGAIRAAIARVDPQAPVEFGTLASVVAASVADRRFLVLLLGLFAVVALLLAAIGIYGVVSYSVAQRSREIGIRVALGAPPHRVGLMVQAGAMAMVGAGIGLGLVGAFGATRLLQSMLYGVAPTDPVAFGAAAALLLATAWLASWAPARRSTRIDPVQAIRGD